MLLLRGAPVSESIQGQYGQPRHSVRTSSRGQKLREALLTGTGQAAEGRVAHVPSEGSLSLQQDGTNPSWELEDLGACPCSERSRVPPQMES